MSHPTFCKRAKSKVCAGPNNRHLPEVAKTMALTSLSEVSYLRRNARHSAELRVAALNTCAVTYGGLTVSIYFSHLFQLTAFLKFIFKISCFPRFLMRPVSPLGSPDFLRSGLWGVDPPRRPGRPSPSPSLPSISASWTIFTAPSGRFAGLGNASISPYPC